MQFHAVEGGFHLSFQRLSRNFVEESPLKVELMNDSFLSGICCRCASVSIIHIVIRIFQIAVASVNITVDVELILNHYR